MQRPATKQSRAANAQERCFMRWIKWRGVCAACLKGGGVICHHFAGSSAKIIVGVERVMFGHWAVNGLCEGCDFIVTHKSRREFREIYGNECDVWFRQSQHYPGVIPENVTRAILAWGK